MIITKQKPFEVILEYLNQDTKIFLIGCTECATICQTGGEEQVKKMAQDLTAKGKQITGSVILSPGCYALEAKKAMQKFKNEIADSDSVLVLSCGDGCQTAQKFFGKKTHIGVDTLFLGERTRGTYFEEKCSLCGDCVLEETGGICPVTICSKGLLNGPCGGTKNRKCEVDKEKECGWILIYENLKATGQLDKMKRIQPPKDHTKWSKPRKLDISK